MTHISWKGAQDDNVSTLLEEVRDAVAGGS
jgi:hypothetical protein